MALSKQAKVLSNKQMETVLIYLSMTRHPLRNKIIFLLSAKAGMRAKEIASLKWNMVLNPEGELTDEIHLTNNASKGRTSGRIIPIHKELKVAMGELLKESVKIKGFDIHQSYIITTERSNYTTAQVIVNTFKRWYEELGFVGCSSHSGRRTFITNCAKKIPMVGGSIRDVQMLAGHSNLQTTQRYIDTDADCQKKVIAMI